MPSPCEAMSPAMDAVFTTCPGCFWATMRGTKASTPWITPQRLTPIAHSQSLWVTASRPPQRATPALLQTTCTAPNSVNARSARACTSVRRLTSVFTARPRRPAWVTPATVSAMPVSSRSATTTSAPSRAKSSASARPIPLAPPVTTAVRPCRLVRGTAPSVAPPSARCQPLLFSTVRSGGRLGARSRAARRGCRTRSGSIWP